MPDTVLAMVAARLEGLEPEARRVLRAASVFGQLFWSGGVEALLGDDAAQVDGWLRVLAEREVILRRRQPRFPEQTEYLFRHALIRDAAYTLLTDRDRKVGHRAAGEWLEAAGETDPIALAEHFDQGEPDPRAVTWYRRAAEQALEGNDWAATIRRVERALACGAQGGERAALLVTAAEAYNWEGRFTEAFEHAELALSLSTPGEVTWSNAVGQLAIACGRRGELARLVQLADECDRLPEPEGGERTVLARRVVAASRVCAQLIFAGQVDRGAALLDRLLPHAVSLERDEPLARAAHLVSSGIRAMYMGEPAASYESLVAAAALFTQLGAMRQACLQHSNAAFACLEVGAFAEAERALVEALPAAVRLGIPQVAASVRENLGKVLTALGRNDEARAVLLEACTSFVAHGDRRNEAICFMYMAHADTGDLVRAEEEARRAVSLLEIGSPMRIAALATLARVLLDRGAIPEALTTSEEAMTLLAAAGAVEEGESLARLTYARTLHASGRDDEARAVLEVARERVLQRAAKIHGPWRQSFVEAIPENVAILSGHL
jgi:tetratricopeptide (TPR) repeat protein